ncbi:MAG: CBS domain-containing protein, partial [Patescibacteria group bacterium]
MKVTDVMARHVEFVSVDTKVKDVATLIFGRGINGLPVCKDRKVVGFITERDILAKFYPSMQDYVEDPFRSGDFENMEKKVDEIFEMTADKIMSKNATTITADTPLLRAQSLMFIEKVGRLPVVDDKGNLVGIISKGDIFKAVVGDKIFFTEDKDYNDWISKTYYRAVDMKNRLEHEMPDLLKILSQNHVAKILDIGCGTGDHAIELAKKGFTVIGTDRSLGMVKEANRRKQILSEETKARVKFFNGETEEILEKLNINFDAVLFMGNT